MGYVPFGAEHSLVSSSLYFVQLWITVVNHHPLQVEALRRRGLRDVGISH